MNDGKPFHVFNLFQESLKLITHCPACQVRYTPGEARMIEECPDYGLVFLKCQACLRGILAVITLNAHGIHSVGMISDLSSEDIQAFRNSQPVSLADVLDLQEQLEKSEVGLDVG